MNEEYKKAYKLGVQANCIPKKILARLHQKTENAVEKYLYVPDRYPDFQNLYELWQYIMMICGTMPRDLDRIVSRPRNRAMGVAKSEGKYKVGSPVKSGHLVQPKTCFYVLNGEQVTVKQLSEMHDTATHNIRHYIKLAGVKHSEDVSSVDFSSRRKSKQERDHARDK